MKPHHQTIFNLLDIPSPTFKEGPLCDFIQERLAHKNPSALHRDDNGIIATFIGNTKFKTIALVGHTDVIPEYVKPYEEGTRLYGSGASDMQAGLGCFLHLVEVDIQDILEVYNVVFIAYNREERTSLEQNGLYSMLSTYPKIFKTIDAAIVGEPTNNTIQLGCVGSLHVGVTVKGEAAHSARPWLGENALYKALPLLQHIEQQTPVKDQLDDLIFTEVMSVTECSVPEGRTTVPDQCWLNINYRFGPTKTESQAWDHMLECIKSSGITDYTYEKIDSVPSGKVINSPLLKNLYQGLQMPIQAKQAWTDVAQLSAAGIPCFNCGPGLQEQAHKTNEYVDLLGVDQYYTVLKKVLTQKEN